MGGGGGYISSKMKDMEARKKTRRAGRKREGKERQIEERGRQKEGVVVKDIMKELTDRKRKKEKRG